MITRQIEHIALAAAMVTMTFAQLSFAEAKMDKPNVVFMLSDNQSYYEMGCHGHAVVKTPNIDRLAKQGVDFQRFYAPPYCSPSRVVMMTGKYALRSGVHDTIGGRSIMHAKSKTIADIMGASGYSTGIFGKWHLGFSYPYRPQDRGFDEVYIHRGGGIGQMEDYYGNEHYNPTFIHNGQEVSTKGYSTDILFDQAMQWIEKQNEKPFFCFVSTPAPHGPHHGPKDENGEKTGLNGMIENFDLNVGRMMAKIDELGLKENTVLIFASDQGMSDRGAPHGGAKRDLTHDSNHHVPFMLRLPGGKPHINKRLAGMIDFVPTVLDLCGLEVPGDLDGISLKPLLTGKESGYPVDRTLIIQCPRGRSAEKWQNASVKTDRWRLSNGKQLYDKLADPHLKHNVADQYPEVVEMMTQKYEAFWETIPDQDTTLCRHELGADECPDVTLNGMDWYTGSRPWNSKHIASRNQNGAWAVRIVKDGAYTFELRQYPREADKAIGVTRAQIKIGDIIKDKQIDTTAACARFSLELKAGDYDLQTWLKSGADAVGFGALFVYVSTK